MKEDNKKKGWVRRYRSIMDHWLYKCKPFCKVAAWDDLVLRANFNEKKFPLGNQFIEVGRGELITSEVKLSQHWGWSRTKVRAFLNQLSYDSMIEKKSDNKKTWVKIMQYSVYNDPETTKNPQKNIKKTSKKHQKNTNNNIKNIKNEKEIKTLKFPYENLVILFFNSLPESIREKTEKELFSWNDCFRKLIDIDGKSPDKIKEIITHFRNDDFWSGAFLSPLKLRRNNPDKIKYIDYFEVNLKRQQKPDAHLSIGAPEPEPEFNKNDPDLEKYNEWKKAGSYFMNLQADMKANNYKSDHPVYTKYISALKEWEWLKEKFGG